MDSGPGACTPSRNDNPLDVSGFTVDQVLCARENLAAN
jgi:hypothetical protein